MPDSTDPTRSTALARTLAALVERYVARTPASRAQYEAAQRSMPGGNTRTVLFYEPWPLAIARGQDCRLWDADGHEYLDFLGEFTAGLYGHSNPVIRAAIDSALDDGISLSGHNLLESRLADLIRERIDSIASLRFTNSGTEANLMAFAAAKAFTGRSKVMVFVGGYHGGVLTFGNGPAKVNVPHDYLYAPYNDEAAVDALFDAHGGEIAAVLVEPMQGSSGCIVGEPVFLQRLRERSAAAGALLIFDEVMTSRLAPGGRQSQLGITPDLTTLGKYLGGGLSFGAFGGRRDVMAQFDPRTPGALTHAGTFNNNTLTMAAGAAGLGSVYTAEAAIALNARGDAMRARLNAICRDAGVGLQFSGLGSLMNFQATAAPIRSVADLQATDPRIKDLLFFFMAERGIYLARRGFVVLSLPITDAHIDRFVAAFAEFVDTHRGLL
ncbi:MAG: aminotransferase class III-fold pyridoxal phosphate-dependent enzyme [Burkholderiales bacterium]